MKIVVHLLFLFLITKCSADIYDRFKSLKDVTQQCKYQLETISRNKNVFLMMFDASSKFPVSGMGFSRNYDYGNHPECLAIRHEYDKGTLLGKYCPMAVAVPNVLQNITNDLNEDGMNAKERDNPNISPVTLLSVCIPDACTPQEVGHIILNITRPIFVPSMCETAESNTEFQVGDVAFLSALGVILVLALICTIYDIYLYNFEKKSKHPMLLAFSFLTNGRKLMHISHGGSEQIECLNGLRFISMMWVIAGHGFVCWETVPVINQHEAGVWQQNLYAQYIESAPIAVDTFFFLSGLLLSYGYLKIGSKLTTSKQFKTIPIMYIHRYLRITPAAAALYFGVITIFRFLGSGPIWNMLSQSMKNSCTDHWWQYFLYVQNYVNYEHMCLVHTWYLSADMQMFILAPIVLIPMASFIKNNFKYVIAGLLGLAVVFTAFPIVIRFLDQDVDNDYETHSRLVDYLIGMIIGAILRIRKEKSFAFTRRMNFIIWVTVIIACISFNLDYHDVIINGNHTKDTLFYGLYRPLWSFCLAWIVYSCHHGYGGFFNTILSLPILQIGGRLSYSMYLVHGLIEMYWVGTNRVELYFSDYQVFYTWCGHFILTIIMSVVWTLLFESPMIVIEKFIFGGSRKPKQESS